jgi:hypothetical protein
VRHRIKQSEALLGYVGAYQASGDEKELIALRDFLLSNDYLASGDTDYDLGKCLNMAETILRYRKFDDTVTCDGLDGVRRNLRALRQSNIDSTKLIICSMEGDRNYPEIDNLTAEPEFADMLDKLIITAEPGYLARFASTTQVVSYQRRFMNAAQGMK